MIGLTNEIPSVTQRSSAWLRVAEYGDWPHPLGLQRFTRQSADQLVRQFKSLRGRLARKFGGLPIYIGHPDDEHFAGQSGHTDTRAYAWVTALEARPDGLYILPRWSDAGQNLLRNAFYKFLSPRWAMRELGGGVYEPVRLVSVGLTNHPNMPGDAIANEAPRSTAPADESPDARIPALLDEYLAKGVIAPNELAHWARGLEADFSLGVNELQARKPVLKTVACSQQLGERAAANAACPSFISLVNERVARTGETFEQSWRVLKQERPELYATFQTF